MKKKFYRGKTSDFLLTIAKNDDFSEISPFSISK